MSDSLSSETIVRKKAAEVITAGMSFSSWLDSGVTITAVSSVAAVSCADGSAANLTFGSSSVSGSTVSFTISGGTRGVRYRVDVTITTSAGNTFIGDGILVVS